ncbi:hypothetical protein NC652_000195 [Populus alba x Populus x berolinensis]|nr:hypothetical protein NC652_000195 [Populus alba x Populus x berolinensis]
MEIEEEEVKLEATEPEKDGAVQTLGLRRRRAPEQPFPVLDQSLTLSSLQVWYPSSLNHFQSLVSLHLSHVKHMVWYPSSLYHLPSLESLHLSHVKHKLTSSLASRKTQQPPPELQANDNLVENLSPSVPSQDDSMNDNDANQHVTITVEAEQLLDAGESSRHREISGWTLLVTNLILEIASAVFDQMGYALIGMVLAFVALLLAAAELIHMAPKERIIWAGMRPILPLHTSATRKPVGTIVEYSGLAGAVWQCVYSTVEYTYTRQEKDNPIKMCLLPFIFLLCVVISKLLVDKRSIDKSS